jgi:hypothetical protein
LEAWKPGSLENGSPFVVHPQDLNPEPIVSRRAYLLLGAGSKHVVEHGPVIHHPQFFLDLKLAGDNAGGMAELLAAAANSADFLIMAALLFRRLFSVIQPKSSPVGLSYSQASLSGRRKFGISLISPFRSLITKPRAGPFIPALRSFEECRRVRRQGDGLTLAT